MARDSFELERNYKKHSVIYDQERFCGKDKEYLEKIRSEAFFSLMPSKKNIKILDVGCGTGRGILMLGANGYYATGLDYTPEMLEIAEKKRKACGLNFVEFIQGNAKKMPFPDNSFDCVVSFNFIHMFGLTPQRHLINEMLRVVKPDGCLIVEFDNYYKALVMGAIVQKAKSRTHFNKPGDLQYLFDSQKVKIDKVKGTVIPYVWRLFQHFPEFCKYIERLSWFYPFQFLSERFYVKGIKK